MCRKFTKVLCLVLMMLLIFSVFSACTSENDESVIKDSDVSADKTGTQKSEAAKEPVKIKYFSIQTGSKDMIQGLIDKFNSKNEGNIFVETTFKAGDYQTALKTSVVSGQGPDVMQGFPDTWQNSIWNGWIAPWDEYLSEEALKRLDEYGWKQTVDGVEHIYCFMAATRTYRLAYNKDIFEKAGLTKTPKTWDEFREYCKVITKAGKGEFYGTCFPCGSLHTSFWTDAICGVEGTAPKGYDLAGAKYYYEPFIPVIEIWREIINDGSVFPGFQTMDNDAMRAQFAEGRIGMYLAVSWDMDTINVQFNGKCNWDVAPVPVVSEAKGLNVLRGGIYYTLNGFSDYKEEGTKFVEYMLSPEYMGTIHGSGTEMVPSQEAIQWAKDNGLKATHPQYDSFTPYDNEVLGYTSLTYPASKYEGASFNQTVVDCLIDNSINIKEAVIDCQDRINAGLVEQALIDVEKNAAAPIKISGIGEILYIPGFDPLNPDFSNVQYISTDEWKKLNN